MADTIDLMLATGARIGEILALRWIDVHLDGDRPKVTISGTIKTEPGKGTYRKPSPKSDSSLRTVIIPKIGRASCRERVSVRVDLGGRRIIKNKNHINYHRSDHTRKSNTTSI